MEGRNLLKTKFNLMDVEYFRAHPEELARVRDLEEGEMETEKDIPTPMNLNQKMWEEAIAFARKTSTDKFPIKIVMLAMNMGNDFIVHYPCCLPDLPHPDPEMDFNICVPIDGEMHFIASDQLAIFVLLTQASLKVLIRKENRPQNSQAN